MLILIPFNLIGYNMIFISAGHHPAKPGATFDRFIEHDEACVWVDMMTNAINNSGGEDSLAVKATAVPVGFLKTKVDFINSRMIHGDIALEVHFNAAVVNGKNVGRGSETLYYPGSEAGKALATVCQEALAAFFPPSRGVKEGWYRMDKTRGADFFLAQTKCPAIIIEPEFVHHFQMIFDNRKDTIELLVVALEEYVE